LSPSRLLKLGVTGPGPIGEGRIVDGAGAGIGAGMITGACFFGALFRLALGLVLTLDLPLLAFNALPLRAAARLAGFFAFFVFFAFRLFAMIVLPDGITSTQSNSRGEVSPK
jgi:hypothetical protein